MKIKISYKEVSILLGILVAILAIFSYWITLHQDDPTSATRQLYPLLNFELVKISKIIQSSLPVLF